VVSSFFLRFACVFVSLSAFWRLYLFFLPVSDWNRLDFCPMI
jgi:hypothetical protein